MVEMLHLQVNKLKRRSYLLWLFRKRKSMEKLTVEGFVDKLGEMGGKGRDLGPFLKK
jgi:hypothetical protein